MYIFKDLKLDFDFPEEINRIMAIYQNSLTCFKKRGKKRYPSNGVTY